MIEANAKGQFDPRKSKFISLEMIKILELVSKEKPNPKLSPLEIE